MNILFYRIFEKEKMYAVLENNDKLRHYVFEKDYLKKPNGPWELNITKETNDIVSLLVKIGHEAIIDSKSDSATQLISFYKQIKKDILSGGENVKIYKECSDDIKNGLYEIFLNQNENKFDCDKFYKLFTNTIQNKKTHTK